MSDLSLVWHEYERNSQLSNQIINDVIALKRTQFGLPGCEKVSPQEITNSRRRLSIFVAATVRSLEPDGPHAEGIKNKIGLHTREVNKDQNQIYEPSKDYDELVQAVPGSLLEHLRELNAGIMPRYINSLLQISQALEENLELSPTEWDLLEGLTGHVHQEASRLFRRLWRK